MTVLTSGAVTSTLEPAQIARIRQLLVQNLPQAAHWIKDLSESEFAYEFSRIAEVKRFLQKCEGDPQFRVRLLEDPQATAKSYGLGIDPQEFRYFWDDKYRHQQSRTLLEQRCLDFYRVSENNKLSDLIDNSHNQAYKAWRQRQLNRCSGQMVKSIHDQIGHFPVCFELSKGCSVGCWFCSVSAPRLSDIFFYTPENAKLWRKVLQVLKKVLGTAAADGFCYWATDPLDNPDYEKFLCDFHDIFGVFPQTTTAQPLKDPARTRSLLKLALERGSVFNRFSILSRKILERVHQEFTPEELAFVGLVQQQPEAEIPKANAGRMRQRTAKKGSKEEVYDEEIAGTNACVTGFLFSMVDRTVKLVSPCPASDRYPNGYRVYAESSFTDAEELETFLVRAMAIYMPQQLRDTDLVRFRADLKYEELDNGFQVVTPILSLKFRNDAYLKQLGRVILDGDKTLAQIVDLFTKIGIQERKIRDAVALMFDKGALQD